ncbi:hypothetical protein KW792_01675 [Candidatus Saccharibacteria bacterium]|nr:hypothetical protein [Candidatus Saccharibacteria bacterium]
MAYSLNHGVDNDGVDNTQRSLLIGLPAIALVLSFGAIKHHANNGNTAQSAKTIPVVSSLSAGGDKPNGDNTNSSPGNIPSSATPASSNILSSTSQRSSTSTGTISGTNSGTTSTGGSGGTTPVGGRGGGPTGGGGGSGVTVPDCSIGQIATVNCRVPACSPAVNLSPGQKAILGLAGTCIVVN